MRTKIHHSIGKNKQKRDMKKFSIIAVIATLFAISCSQFEQTDTMPTISVGPERYYATFGDETKTFVESNKYLRWHAEDEISVFPAHTTNIPYLFEGETGDNNGSFKSLATDEVVGSPLNYTYAVYPHSTATTISAEGVLSVMLPSTQQYAQNSFGRGANTSVAITDNISSDRLYFKNACGFLKLRLYGEVLTVKSVTLRGNNNEKIAGAATISVDANGTPTTTMSENATTAVTIVCDEGVTLGASAEESVEFWFVLPEVTFTKGFTVFVSGEEREMKQSTSNSVTIERNKILPMETLLVVPNITIANRKIYYTSSDGKVVKPNKSDVFGANIISNTYENGQGVIEFDGEVTKIGGSAFYNCSTLASVIIPESATSIGGSAFYHCTSLTSVEISDSVTSIGISAFSGCTLLTDVVIPNSVTSIGMSAFTGCTSLISVVIPNRVTSMSRYAFSGCTSLSSVTLPNTLTSIDSYAFSGCTSLKSIAVPKSVNTMNSSAFINCTNLARVDISDLSAWCRITFRSANANPLYYGADLYLNNTKLTDVTIPSDISKLTNNVFYNCKSLVRVTIPNNVISIGGSAFRCSNITDIQIADSVTEISSYAFCSCSSLNSVTLSKELTIISDYLFKDCCNLKSITIPSKVTSIAEQAFSGCSSLNSVVIEGNGIKSIGQSAFYKCHSLVSFNIPVGVSTIDQYAFCECSNMQSVNIPSTVKNIKEGAFKECTSLKEIILPEGVTTLGHYVFRGCSSVEKVIIPSTITSFGDTVFAGCTGEATINCEIPNAKKYNNGTVCYGAFGNSFFHKVTISEGITTIGDYAFEYNSKLKEVVLPESLTTIKGYAFHECSGLTHFTIPKNIATIGTRAFWECSNLHLVYCCPATPPTLGVGVFAEANADLIIKVSAKSIDAYMAASDWDPYEVCLEVSAGL